MSQTVKTKFEETVIRNFDKSTFPTHSMNALGTYIKVKLPYQLFENLALETKRK